MEKPVRFAQTRSLTQFQCLEHFHFRCLQGNQFRRGFCPSKKPLFTTLASCILEVKML
jgi:hypothetical protein